MASVSAAICGAPVSQEFDGFGFRGDCGRASFGLGENFVGFVPMTVPT